MAVPAPDPLLLKVIAVDVPSAEATTPRTLMRRPGWAAKTTSSVALAAVEWLALSGLLRTAFRPSVSSAPPAGSEVGNDPAFSESDSKIVNETPGSVGFWRVTAT